MNKYSDYLGSVLRERVETLQERAMGAITLRDEKALLEQLVGEAVANYERVYRQTESLPDAQKFAVRNVAANYVVNAIKEVREITLAEHKITESGRQVDVGVVHAMVVQLVGFLDQALASGITHPAELMDNLTERARSELLTVDAVATSRITPESIDAEVRELLSTVPGPPAKLKVG